MEETKGAPDLLDVMVQPGFYVENDTITRLNAAAEGLLLRPGMDIRPLITAGLAEYEHFQGGCYEFAMAKAPVETELHFDGFSDIEAGIVKWPMSVIRLNCPDY